MRDLSLGQGSGERRRERELGRSQWEPEAEAGQATVELALCLPVVVVLLLAVVQVGLLVADQVAVVQAAREGARAASVDPDPEAARRAALGGRLGPGDTTVDVARSGGPPAVVRVTVRHQARTDVPLLGVVLPSIGLSAEATLATQDRGP